MKLFVLKGTTSLIVHIFVGDSSSTSGNGLTGLVYNSASLVAYYIRPGDSSATAITLATATIGTYSSGGFKEVSSANMPGVYEFHIPNACLASGANQCVIMLKGATNMAPVVLEIQLTDWDFQDSVTAVRMKAFYNSVEYGTAQAGGASTITLRSGAHSSQDNFYADQSIVILSGAGAGQTNRIVSYVAATRVATVATPWVSGQTPDNTSIYLITGRIG